MTFRRYAILAATFAAGWMVGRSRTPEADPRELNPVEVRNNRGLHARLTAHRLTIANPSAVISDSTDLTTAPDDARPLWRITFADGKVAYLLTEDSPTP